MIHLADFPYSYTVLHNSPLFCVAEAVPLFPASRTRLLQVYVSPRQNRALGILTACLDLLSPKVTTSTVIAGDFNSPIGTPRRSQLDAWCARHSLRILPSPPTHIRASCTPSVLDVVMVPFTWNPSLSVVQSTFDHQPVVVTLTTGAQRLRPPRTIAWKRLGSDRQRQQFLETLAASLDGDPFSSLLRAGSTCLGYTVRRPRPFLDSVRERSAEVDRWTITEVDLENSRDLDLARRLRVESHASPTRMWQLFRPRSTAPPDPHQVATTLQPVYTARDYPARAWASAQAAQLCNVDYLASPLDRPFEPCEIYRCLQWIGRNKAPGPDSIPHGALAAASASPPFLSALADYYNGMLISSVPIPPLTAILHAIPKPTGGVRPIMIQEKRVSILEALIWARIRRDAPELIHFEDQFGFTPGLGCVSHLLRTQSYLSRLRTACFLDLSKAFDSVPRDYVVACLGEVAGSKFGRLLALVARLTLQPRLATVAPTAANVSIRIETGVPQGGILSPWLFNCVMSLLQKSVKGIPSPPSPCLNLYADDVALFAADCSSLQRAVDAAVAAVRDWGGHFNAAKTEFLTSLRTRPLLLVDGTRIFPRSRAKLLGRLLQWRRSRIIPHDPTPLLNKLQSRIADGLPIRLAMVIFRAKYWSKLLYAAELFPPPLTICHIHLSSLRCLLQLRAFRTHRCTTQREAGALFHPIVWIHARIVSLLSSLTPDQRTSLLLDDQWWQLAANYLGDTRSRDAILSQPQSHLKEIAQRITDAILAEARIKGIYRAADPVWQPPFLLPKAYLSLRQAGIATLFRAPSFNAPDIGRVLCPFCMNGEDSGFHYTYQCCDLPEELARERAALIQLCGSADRLRLSDDAWVTKHRPDAIRVLAWMKNTYVARAQHNVSLHNRRLFYDVAVVPVPPNPRQQLVSPPATPGSQEPDPPAAHVCPNCQKQFATAMRLRMHLRNAYSCRQTTSVVLPVEDPSSDDFVIWLDDEVEVPVADAEAPYSDSSTQPAASLPPPAAVLTTLAPPTALPAPSSSSPSGHCCPQGHKRFGRPGDLQQHLRLAVNCKAKQFAPPPASPIPPELLLEVADGRRCKGCNIEFRGEGFLRTHLRLHKTCSAARRVQAALPPPSPGPLSTSPRIPVTPSFLCGRSLVLPRRT